MNLNLGLGGMTWSQWQLNSYWGQNLGLILRLQ